MKIAVIDGQGGGLGKVIISRLREEFGNSNEILALGTNSAATSGMLKAGADRGATGENAIAVGCRNVELILGPIAIIIPDALLGEISTATAHAVAACSATKLLLPVNKCGITVIGTTDIGTGPLLDELMRKIREMMT